ncbi:MAG: hypothetical protein ABSC94_15565 [Polyangiaceae bacterium]
MQRAERRFRVLPAERAPLPERSLRAWLLARARFALVIVGAAVLWATWHTRTIPPRGLEPEAAIAEALAARGLSCEVADVQWLERKDGLGEAIVGGPRALVRAAAAGEPHDLYLVEARLAPGGTLLDVENMLNLTETSGVDESRPLLRGPLALYITSADGLVSGVHVLDFGGCRPSAYAGFSRLQRWQAAITNLQQTGQASGVLHTAFVLDPIARRASAEWRSDGMVQARSDENIIVIDPARSMVVAGDRFVRVIADERARPGNLITWAVDRVRAIPWVGDDKMQWLKAVAFTLTDKWNVVFSNRTTVEDVRSELGIAGAATLALPSFVDPEVGWPPKPIVPVVSPALSGEGQWIPLDHDPFITPTPSGASPALVTSFLRPDPRRLDERVYVTLWDPRQIALHMEAGTVEPVSASGEHGPGLIPRTPAVMDRLVAAFNGGFQAQHGEYGMQVDGVDYLPPKPYAATVLELSDGSNAFGAWPDSPTVPDGTIAFRQNLTALVQGDKFNPWGRTWWGGTPPGWPDQIHSTRSALCLTTEGFVGYFYSMSISAEDLGAGMLAARCSFGIHLDMNPGHAGFEFYDVGPIERIPPLARRPQPDWEAQGKVPDMSGYAFRARRMIRGMGHMLFPRYIQREARDFFYLTMRPTLPGAAVESSGPVAASSEGENGAWRTKRLPQHGFPYALATTSVHPDAARPDLVVRVLRADPRTMQPAQTATADAPTVLSLTAPARGSQSLFWSHGAFVVAANAPTDEATWLAAGHPLDDPRAAHARAAFGVQDADGMLAWVELGPDVRADSSTAAILDGLLARLGCNSRVGIPGTAQAWLGETLDLAGDAPSQAPQPTSRLVRAHAPDAHSIFSNTPIVPIQVWQPLQAKRVRYFYKPAASASATTGARP